MFTWTAMHPAGESEALFRMDAQTKDSSVINVFSMSNYLRQCTGDRLELEMPRTHGQLRWLTELFPGGTGG